MTNLLLFGQFLKKKGAWEAYKTNYRSSDFRNEYPSPFKQYISGESGATWLLEAAFDWYDSPEGDVYWENILDAWDDFLFHYNDNGS